MSHEHDALQMQVIHNIHNTSHIFITGQSYNWLSTSVVCLTLQTLGIAHMHSLLNPYANLFWDKDCAVSASSVRRGSSKNTTTNINIVNIQCFCLWWKNKKCYVPWYWRWSISFSFQQSNNQKEYLGSKNAKQLVRFYCTTANLSSSWYDRKCWI